MAAVEKRLREELAKLQVEMNEEKSRKVDLSKARASDFWALSSVVSGVVGGVWRAYYMPKLKKRTALLRKLKDIFRRYQSQPVSRVIANDQSDPARLGELLCGRPLESVLLLHPRLGGKEDPAPSGACSKRQGFGWKRWSRQWLYETLGCSTTTGFDDQC